MNRLSKPFLSTIEKLKIWNTTLADEFAQLANRQSDTTFIIHSIKFENDSISHTIPPPNVLFEFTLPNFNNSDYRLIRLVVPISYPTVPPTVFLEDRNGNFHSYKNLLLDLWKNELSVFNLTRLIHILTNQPFLKKDQQEIPIAPPKPKPKTPTTAPTSLSSNFHSLSLGSSKPPIPAKPSHPITSQVPSTEKLSIQEKKDIHSAPSVPPHPTPYASSFVDASQTDIPTEKPSSPLSMGMRNIQKPPALPPKQTGTPIPSKSYISESFPQTTGNTIPSNNSTMNLLDEDINFSANYKDGESERRRIERQRLDEIKNRWKERVDSKLLQQIKTFQSLRLKKELLDNEKNSLQELAKEIDKKRFLLGITRRKLREDLHRATAAESLPIEELYTIPSIIDRKRYKLTSNDAVLNNSIQALNSALVQESVSIQGWMKAVKLLARQQFFIRDDMLHL
ncbi:ESCRT I complex subunit Vps23 [Schizosaccharomyces octosporus yFS286]|uniref:ESCRT I complex subunit Vps23 n=1 Tax=Schizosaccharomyces octosporus (strain yFS286) TaxID=483514 RepID=S9Q0D3_SCHOY|nr:ESCRT I complex subunit Vps23 [Schizosaccharomyces octosporus yFS286]EPX73168.1 ESCRT I complex subunit Vps23 [Schizosaccharomyces octosporus yFS286]